MEKNQSELKSSGQLSGWVGAWALGAGALLLAERLGWISDDLKWGVPLLLMVFGASIIYDSIRRR